MTEHLAEEQKTACARISYYFQFYTLRHCEAETKKHCIKTIEPDFQIVIHLKVQPMYKVLI